MSWPAVGPGETLQSRWPWTKASSVQELFALSPRQGDLPLAANPFFIRPYWAFGTMTDPIANWVGTFSIIEVLTRSETVLILSQEFLIGRAKPHSSVRGLYDTTP
jgi:hypothetical protein